MKAELIIRYLESRCTAEDLSEINQWLEESPDNQQWLFDIKALWDKRLIAEFSRKDYLDSQFLATLQKIERTESVSKKRSTKRLVRLVTSFAAAACVASILYVLFVDPRIHSLSPEYVVERVLSKDSIRRILLPDSSVVWLGANSELKYLSSFNENERHVILSGEAYFDVVKDAEKHPFRVETPDFTVKVLGTQFNVSSYQGRATTETALLTGRIVIENEKHQEILALVPGQKVIYTKDSRQLSVENYKVKENSIALSDNYITFRNAAIQEIVKRLQYTYGTPIEIDESLTNSTHTYTGSIQYETNLEKFLEKLQYVIPFNFKKNMTGTIQIMQERESQID